MKIRAFDVYRQRRKVCFYLKGIKLCAVDVAEVQKRPGLIDATVDKLSNMLHPVLKRMDAEPEYFGELIAEFNGVQV